MKAVRYILLLVATLMPAVQVRSQNVVPGSDELLARLRLNESMFGSKFSSYNDISGDPYVYKEFRPGRLILRTGETASADMRYDIYADLIHIKLKENIFAIGFPEKLSMIRIDSLTFINDTIIRKGNRETLAKSSWFIVAEEGKCSLLIKKNIRIQDPEPAKILQDAKPARFIHTADSYYLKQQDGHAVLVKARKDLTSVLSDHKEDIITFIKSQGFGIKKIEDLSAIVRYYNGL